MKAAFYTLGCKVNQYESQAMAQELKNAGYDIVPHNSEADVYIINSCTVTSESDRKTRQAVRRFKKNHPDSCIVLTGCMSQVNKNTKNLLPEADIILGNNSNENLIKDLEEYFKNKEKISDIIDHLSSEKFKGSTVSDFDERERAFIKIQDGCNRFCTYCIIPYARGRARSKPLEEIKAEIENIANNGYKEVVLTGINLSSYGMDIGEKFIDAIKTACSVETVERVRLGSLEPDHITDELIDELSKLDKFCPQFHLSLQSGCNSTLKRMNRHYTAEEYEALCNKLRNTFENTTITTDVMVGFPYESEEDFTESLNFVRKIGFEKVHVFPYSVREGTKAASMEQIEKSIKEKRAKIMIEETDKIREDFLKSQVGKTVEVLVESAQINGLNIGFTKNYIPVAFECKNEDISKIRKVKIKSSDKEYCYATLI